MSDLTEKAVRCWQRGQRVAFPTETVYGVGVDAMQSDAVAALFALKGRPLSVPITLHIGDQVDPARFASITPQAQQLIDAFWPGPLTLVLEKTECVPNIVVAGGPTVGLRMPSHWVCTALLNAFGGAIAATSANAHGQPSPTTASQVADTLGDSVSLIVEGGLTPTGLDSTVLGWVGGVPTVFRAGGVGRDNLERVLGRRLGESPS